MKKKYHEITVEFYLDFIQLLQDYKGSHKENRLFALKHKSLLEKPKELILLWFDTNAFRKRKHLDSEKFLTNFGIINSFMGLFSLLFGFFVGMGLLSYNGIEPVNIIYYLFFAMLLPLGSMLLTLFSIFSSGKLFSFFSLFSPMHWIEKLSIYFSFKNKFDLFSENISFKLQKWIFLKRLQLLSLLFSAGLLVALVFMVVSQDIAFSWSTTLQVDASSFHSFLESVSFPWRDFFPTSVPSLELVEVSHYYRLGEKINPEMLENADKLGAWWKFLFMSTFFYALVLRFFFYLYSAYTFKKVLEKEFCDLNGIKKLLREFTSPFIETRAPKRERHLEIKKEHKKQVKTFVKEEPKKETIEEKNISKENIPKEVKEEKNLPKETIEDEIIEEEIIEEEIKEHSYHSIIAWNFSDDEVLLVNDSKNINANFISTVGGSHTFEEDEAVINRAEDKVIFYVKSWEPPTMDFVDFLEDLIANKKVDEIELLPLGIADNNYVVTRKEFSIWNRKIEGLKSEKVWIINAE
ncbi:hypothetical protein MNB_SV-13-1803 [hydrothermal vent metagenome]|uniref:DUF2868 domain-containing protein n=1 Tax=hydrothermal vent metagenome TaxID=652676 RepID=A0A1W1D1C1_9ZZZZ